MGEMKLKLHEYQKKTIAFCKGKQSVILAIDMGLGKTTSILHYIDELKPEKVLIIAPKRVATNVWMQEAEKWGLQDIYDKMAIVEGTPKQREALWQDISKPYKIVGRDNFKDYENYECDLLVIDELTTAKNVQAKRTQSILSIKAKQKIGLTGTFTNTGEDVFGQARAVGLFDDERINFYSWRAFYFKNVLANTGLKFQKWVLRKEYKLDDLLKPIRKSIFTLDADDWLEMPEYTFNKHLINLTKPEMTEYMRLQTMLQINLDGVMHSVKEQAKGAKIIQAVNGFIYDKGGAAHRGKESTKLEQVADFIESAVSEGEKVLIFYAYKEEVLWLSEKLDKRGVTYCSPNAKNFIEKFRDEVDCLIAHPMSAGHGIDRLQHFCRVIVWSSLTWSLELFMQSNSRVVRQGQKRNVSINIFACKDTIEEKVYEALTKKEDVHDEFIELTKTVKDENITAGTQLKLF